MKGFTCLLFALGMLSQVHPQDSSDVNESSAGKNAAVILTAGIIVPLAIAGTVISIIPPSVSFIARDGVNYGALNFETGIGIGENRETGEFSTWRGSLSYSYVFSSKVRDIFHAEVKKDFNFDFIDERKLFLAGFHISAGLLSDFPHHGYSIGSGAWMKTPWLSYFGFFPQHTFGAAYRYNKYFDGKGFHEISLGITSSFTF